MKKFLVLFVVLGSLFIMGCDTGTNLGGGYGGSGNDSNLVGKWTNDDDEQFLFAATTYIFRKTEGGYFSAFSGQYTYTHSNSKMVFKIINVTGWAIFVVQPGQSIEATVLWHDENTITINVPTDVGLSKTWKRQS
jgi:hypothetical protein